MVEGWNGGLNIMIFQVEMVLVSATENEKECTGLMAVVLVTLVNFCLWWWQLQ